MDRKFLVDHKQYVKLSAELPHETICLIWCPPWHCFRSITVPVFFSRLRDSVNDGVLNMYADTKLCNVTSWR